jgi:hypothetical protein
MTQVEILDSRLDILPADLSVRLLNSLLSEEFMVVFVMLHIFSAAQLPVVVQ